MTEWWSYTLSDFLLFSPRAYYRLLSRHNEAVWPAQIFTLGLGLFLLGSLRRRRGWQGRVVSTALAILWIWVGVAFVWQRYTTINWTAIYLVPLFAVEALLLVWLGVVRGRLTFRLGRDAAGIHGMALFIFGMLLYPAIAHLAGRGWDQAEVFGVAPDPTAIATLGLLLLAEGLPRWELLPAPILWCLVSGATLWAMGSPEAWVPPLAAGLALSVSALKHGKPSATKHADLWEKGPNE